MPEVDVCKFVPRQAGIVWCWGCAHSPCPGGAGLPQHLRHPEPRGACCTGAATSTKHLSLLLQQRLHKATTISLFCIMPKVLKGGKPKSLGNNLSVDRSRCCEMCSVALKSTIAAQFFIKSDRACIFTVFRFQDHQANSAIEKHDFCFKGKLSYFEPFLCLLRKSYTCSSSPNACYCTRCFFSIVCLVLFFLMGDAFFYKKTQIITLGDQRCFF